MWIFISVRIKRFIHTIKFSESSKLFCDILPYFGTTIYVYHRMSVGLNVCPAKWQFYTNYSKQSCERSKHLAMNDYLLLNSSKHHHWKYAKDLIKVLLKNGLKVPPMKSLLLKTEITVHVHYIFIKDKRVCIKPVNTQRMSAVRKETIKEKQDSK